MNKLFTAALAAVVLVGIVGPASAATVKKEVIKKGPHTTVVKKTVTKHTLAHPFGKKVVVSKKVVHH
jgi:predicted thioesterase